MLPINLNHFYYFYEVARHGSFTAAARNLMVSQSSLSIQIRQLERDMGRQLFDRRRGGVDLTDSGSVAYQVAERVFHDVDQMMSTLQETDRRFSGLISLATVNSIGIYELPQFLPALRAAYPDVRIKIDFTLAEQALDLLNSGKVDFAIIPSNRKYAELTGVNIKRNKMFLVAPPDHPLALKESVSPRDLEPYAFVGFQEGMQTRATIDALFKRMSVSVEYAIESANPATIKHMVLAGMGLAILPDVSVAAELRRGQLKRIDVPTLMLSRDIVLYYRSKRALSATREEFVKFIVEYFSPKRHRRTT